MNTLAERLTYALKLRGKTKTDLWKACGISSGAVTHWFTGLAQGLTGKNLTIVAALLQVNAIWLATGEGEMLLKNNDPGLIKLNDIFDQLPPEAQEELVQFAIFKYGLQNK